MKHVSRHELVNNNLAESWSAEKLDDQLSVRSNFKTVLKTVKDVQFANYVQVLLFDDCD